MNWHFSLFDVVVIIGTTQGFFIAVLIWLNKAGSRSKLLLSLVLTVFNLLCIKILIHTTGLWQTPFLRYFPLSFDLAIQPLIWLYTASLTKPGFTLQKKDGLHFMPFAVSFAYSLFVYIAVLAQPELAAKDAIAKRFYFNAVKETEDFLSIVSALLYWWQGLRLILQYRRWLNDTISDTGYPTYTWLRNVAVLMGILIAGLTTAIVLDYFFQVGIHHFLHWQLFFVYLATLIYYLGFRGYQLPEKPAPADNRIDEPDIVLTGEEPETKLTPDVSAPVMQAIVAAFEKDRLYLDAELNLQKLANHIQVSPTLVSAIINNHLQKSFRTLVNDYRLEAVKQRLTDPRSAHLSILGIAYECGFNSEASFYRIFKAGVGMSPKEYIRQQASPE